MTKTLTRQQLKQALRKFYGNGRNLTYAYQTVDMSVEKNWTGLHNVCPCSSGGYFSFTYIGDKKFECKSTFPELLRV